MGPFDKGVLARLQRRFGHLLELPGGVAGLVEIIANRALDTVRPLTARIEHTPIGLFRGPPEGLLIDGAGPE